MFVCNCKSVTENDIKKLRRQGTSCVRELGSKCGAGTDCGSCVVWLQEILQTKEAATQTDALAQKAENADPAAGES